MTEFWIFTAAMIAVALALLAPTLLRRQTADPDAGREQNVAIAREHLDELVKQKTAGDLSDEEFAQARRDLEVALAEDLESTGSQATQARSGGRWALPVAAVLIPLITIPVYLHIGSPNLITGQPRTAAASSPLPPLDEMVDKLRARMEADPGNAEGWFLLGRTYMRLQNYADAVYAYEKVVELVPDQAAPLLSLADALAMRDDRKIGERAQGLLRKALSINPDSVTALWLLGTAAFDKNELTTALDLWQRAYPLLADQPQMQAELGQMIAEAGGTPPQAPVSDIVSIEAAPGATTPTSDKPTSAEATITVEVALAPFLMEETDPDDTVFVLARAETGPPMPLAVSRHQVSELPLRVTLTDAMAMMPAMRLSAFPRVKVTAKVSKSGQAGTQPGDLLANDRIVDSATPSANVQLLIDQVAQ